MRLLFAVVEFVPSADWFIITPGAPNCQKTELRSLRPHRRRAVRSLRHAGVLSGGHLRLREPPQRSEQCEFKEATEAKAAGSIG